ncbi:hypothetical protein [Aliiruegeria sabulilitoris]|uniref:hypothetical protein n=1 Tax=Aliiruegeria sabulilitoris TaxID=1510458 RepID=UPI000835B44E|nr:hypothetical protein [Aliiruegeria sabulilitoris]NDR59575.1 hypothetical protein [Pseudoruegeria sp. M32A2M]
MAIRARTCEWEEAISSWLIWLKPSTRSAALGLSDSRSNAATAPELAGKGGAFLADCGIWPANDADGFGDGVGSWAIYAEAAERLWHVSENMPGQAFAY